MVQNEYTHCIGPPIVSVINAYDSMFQDLSNSHVVANKRIESNRSIALGIPGQVTRYIVRWRMRMKLKWTWFKKPCKNRSIIKVKYQARRIAQQESPKRRRRREYEGVTKRERRDNPRVTHARHRQHTHSRSLIWFACAGHGLCRFVSLSLACDEACV